MKTNSVYKPKFFTIPIFLGISILLFALLHSVRIYSQTVTYVYNTCTNTSWNNNYLYVGDGNLATSGNDNTDGNFLTLTGNDCPGTALGSITKVETRVSFNNNYTNGQPTKNNVAQLTPFFNGSVAGSAYNDPVGNWSNKHWSSYFDITSDPNAPGAWTWSDIQNLDMRCTDYRPNIGTIDVFQIEIRVTYTPGPALSTSTLTGFGNVCTNTTAGPNSFTITGTSLTAANVTVGALSGFTYSTTSGGTYTSSLSLTQAGGAYSQAIYVKFAPTAVQSYNGNIPVGGGGASSVNVAATGSGVNTVPTVTSQTSASVTSTTATLGGTITSTGCTNVTERGIYYSTTSGFADGTGTKVSETAGAPYGIGVFTIPVTGLTPSTVYYYKAFATNGGGSGYSVQGTFTTTCASGMSGTKTIGPSGNYTSITAALAAMAPCGISASVNLVLQSNYVSSVETFPITVPSIPGASTTSTITIYPAVTGRSITSNNSTGTINLNGADYFIIDGRVGPTETAGDLVIENTSTGGYAIQFINDATNNKIQFCDIKGSNTLTTEGVVFFSTGTSSGNDNNTITNCDLGNASGGTPLYLIYSQGSAGQVNNNNTVSNCELHDYFVNGDKAAGINCNTNSSAWTISGNSFYQTSSRSATSASALDGIQCYAGDSYTISNNYVGGSGASCAGTLTYGGNVNCSFSGIYFHSTMGTTNACTITGNYIRNIAFTSRPSSDAFTFNGIHLLGGNANLSNNVIGAATGTASITITINGNSNDSYASGIWFEGVAGSIQNNSIGAVSLLDNGTSANSIANLNLIHVVPSSLSADFTISGNTIGSTTTASSIQTNTGTAIHKKIKGIYAVAKSGLTMNITNNTVANILNANSAYFWNGSEFIGTSTYVNGIECNGSNGKAVITGNTVRNITSASKSKLTGNGATVTGILCSSGNTTYEHLISQNTVYSLKSTNIPIGESVTANGIVAECKAIVEKNFIHSLELASLSEAFTSGATGIQLNSGTLYTTVTCKNNIIRLGLDASGNSITKGTSFACIWAINVAAPPSTTKYNNKYYIYNNSLFVDGSGAAHSPVFSAPLFCENGGSHIIKNNIMFNNRTGTADQHFAMVIGDYTGGFGPTIVDNNCYWRPEGEGYTLINGTKSGVTTNYNELEDWQEAAPGFDVNSVMNEPGFVNENGATPDLHMRPSAGPCSNAGATGTGVTDDFDGQARSATTPDIGADEYNDPVSITWNSSGSTDWNVTGNWTVTTIPKRADVIVIPAGRPAYPIVTSAYRAGAYNVTIDAGASITINKNAALDITGIITNNNDVNGIVIKSESTGTGSLKQKYNGTPGTIERFVTGSENLSAMQYHMVSVPSTPASTSLSGIFFGSYLFDFDELNNAWNGLGTPTTTPLDETRGYLIYAPFGTGDTYKFKNPMNSGSFSPRVTYNGAGINDKSKGWNLIPNPYPSAINWDALKGWTKTSIDGGIYFWPAGAAASSTNYKSYNDGLGVGTLGATKYVPVGQSFFVHANAPGAVLTMTNRVRVHNTQAFWKSLEPDTAVLPNTLRIIATTGGMTDEIIVHFREDASENFDGQYDTYKMTGGADAPQLCSVTEDGTKLTINAMPFSYGEKIIPLVFTLKTPAEVTFITSGTENFYMVPPIFLEDLAEGKVIDLQQQPEYTFTYQPGQPNRFRLRFTDVTATHDAELNEGTLFYSNGKINIFVPGMEGENALVQTFDITGRQLNTAQINLNGVSQVDSHLPTGVYIVRVIAGSKVFTRRIVVQ